MTTNEYVLNGETAAPDLPAGVSLTAVGIAFGRVAESRRADQLFDDPYARHFVAATGWEATEQVHAITPYVALRTRFYDDRLRGAAQSGIRQVVLLAAGLDTRAFRLNWPSGTRLFEVDLPRLLEFKERVLGSVSAAPACERTVVPADLYDPVWTSALTGAGFRPEEPTAWQIEGLLPYFTEEENDRLLSAVGDLSAPGTVLALDHIDSASMRGRLRAMAAEVRSMGADWKSVLDDPGTWLAGHGWRMTDRPDFAELAARYGRAAEPGVPTGTSGLVGAVRQR
ncbi:SAM-dependent methyltransferase [Streptomyces sp. NPDC041068]|uniref:class I SAM-dependent methyltransferase n=1 Tax=Streptomyces sp. NPDC041068 TaxID=3155130 RepID=UPI0033FF8B64